MTALPEHIGLTAGEIGFLSGLMGWDRGGVARQALGFTTDLPDTLVSGSAAILIERGLLQVGPEGFDLRPDLARTARHLCEPEVTASLSLVTRGRLARLVLIGQATETTVFNSLAPGIYQARGVDLAVSATMGEIATDFMNRDSERLIGVAVHHPTTTNDCALILGEDHSWALVTGRGRTDVPTRESALAQFIDEIDAIVGSATVG